MPEVWACPSHPFCPLKAPCPHFLHKVRIYALETPPFWTIVPRQSEYPFLLYTIAHQGLCEHFFTTSFVQDSVVSAERREGERRLFQLSQKKKIIIIQPCNSGRSYISDRIRALGEKRFRPTHFFPGQGTRGSLIMHLKSFFVNLWLIKILLSDPEC